MKKYFHKDLISLLIVVIFIFWGIYSLIGTKIETLLEKAKIYEDRKFKALSEVDVNGVGKTTLSNINEQDNYIIHLGYIGDFISGSLGISLSVITLIVVLITFIKERDRVERQKFEDRFFKLLEIHRENVHEMRISHTSYDKSVELQGEDKGSKVILSIVRELLAINKFIKNNENNLNLTKYRLSNKERMQLSYIILFFGLGKRSNKVAGKYLEYLSYKINIDVIIKILTNTNNRKLISEDAPIKFKSIGGHQTRLGHYFRNLYFCIKVVDENNNLSNKEKLDYVKHVRIQLNTYEQVLLLVNSLTFLGKNWEKYIVIYQLLKNIPYNILDGENEFSVDKYINILCQKYQDEIYNFHKIGWEEFFNDYFEFNEYPKLKI